MAATTLHRTESSVDVSTHSHIVAHHVRRSSGSGNSAEERLLKLENKMDFSHSGFVGHGARLATLEEAITAQSAKIAGLQAAIEIQNKELGVLRTAISAKDADVTRLEATIKDIGTHLATARSANIALEGRIKEVERETQKEKDKERSRCCST